MGESYGPWQRPDYEGDDIYPGFACWDKRQTGSVTIGRTRLPAWAIIHTALQGGWDEVVDGYEPTCTDREFAGFLYHLLECRGEFGRLLLALANAERVEREREAAESDRHFAEVHPGGHVCDCGYSPQPAWWDDPDLAQPVLDQLRRCLDVLEDTVGVRGDLADAVLAKTGYCAPCVLGRHEDCIAGSTDVCLCFDADPDHDSAIETGPDGTPS